ncbi:MAG: SDR family oxidoreductase [Bacteroidetes bacterium]|nr:SDR family oxidoreductase [Bacteroidota bacterium]
MPYAIVSGGTQGIGKAIAEKLLTNGFSVAICARNAEDLKQLETKWKALYPNVQVLAIPTDMTIKEQVLSFAKQVLSTFPTIDVLVNNAGTYYPGNIATEPDGQLESLMALNMYSAYHLTRAVLPAMKKSDNGHIFNMCSIASLSAYPNGGAYSISKYALLGFSENLRLELIPERIRVTSICSGAVYTRSWGDSIDPNRIMKPEDVADSIWSAYSLSPQANIDTIVIRPQQGDL